jgi:hypothetical protein
VCHTHLYLARRSIQNHADANPDAEEKNHVETTDYAAKRITEGGGGGSGIISEE